MAHYRKIDTRVWNDAKFRSLSDGGKLVFFFLLTHPGMTAIGAMRASVPGLAAELGWTPKAFGEAFGEALAKGMARHDETACVVWLPNFIRYNAPENPNVLRAWGKAIDMLPECALTTESIQSVKAFADGLTKAFQEALPEAFSKGMPKQEQEQEQEQTPIPAAPVRPIASMPPAGFMAFWAAYPSGRRQGRGKCAALWVRQRLEARAAEIVLHVEAMKLTPTWMKDGGQYIPGAQTYLSEQRYEDGVPEGQIKRAMVN